MKGAQRQVEDAQRQVKEVRRWMNLLALSAFKKIGYYIALWPNADKGKQNEEIK